MKDADMKHADHAFGEHDHDMAGYNNAQEMASGGKSGYAVPQEQFAYDTSYQPSAHGQRGH
jgi:hypothetical protein